MPVPETPIHKNYGPVFREDQIGLSRQFPVMEPETKSQFMQSAPDNHFRLGILGPDA